MEIIISHSTQEFKFYCSSFSEWKKQIRDVPISGSVSVSIQVGKSLLAIKTPFNADQKNNEIYLKQYFQLLIESHDFYASLGRAPGKRKLYINGVRVLDKK